MIAPFSTAMHAPFSASGVPSVATMVSLSLESVLGDLPLHQMTMDVQQCGIDFARALETDPLLPGTVLMEGDRFVGLLSRRRFLKHLSRQYGQELFLRRPLQVVYQYARMDEQVFAADAPVVATARQVLGRSPEMLYEPITVHLGETDYRILDIHQLLVAQSHIHELAMAQIQQQTRAQMIQTEKMASLGQMIAGIAHEIKNPVNFISGNVSYLNRYADDLINMLQAYQTEYVTPSPGLQEQLEELEFEFLKTDLPSLIESMRMGSEQLKKIIAGLQNFSHMGSGSLKPSDLHQCIDSTLIVLNNRLREGIETVRVYGDLPPVPCFPGQLSQVFMNLLSNAVDALQEMGAQRRQAAERDPNLVARARLVGKPVTFLLEDAWQPQITIRTRSVDGLFEPVPSECRDRGVMRWVVVEVADNGPGIPEEIQTQIFETFFTTKPVGKGTGLGLAIAHEIVTHHHQGCLQLRSQPPSELDPALPSTVFEVWLPLEVPLAAYGETA